MPKTKEGTVNTDLNMPHFDLQTRGGAGHEEIFDIVRKKWVADTPEEWVRQHVVNLFYSQLGYPLELMQVEGSISLNRMNRRCDIVVYNPAAKPVMIVECKRPNVPLTQKVIDQICRYNFVLQVPFLYVTNGMQHLMLKADPVHQRLIQTRSLPSWDELKG